MKSIWACAAALVFAAISPTFADGPPIKIGFSAEANDGSAASGRQFVLAAQIWADEVNAKGGLLGRKVELIHYDDQSNPSLVPGIYTKLLDVDKIDLVIASGTNFSAIAIALAGADAEFAKNATAGAREHIKKYGLQIVYDRSYPLNTC